MKPSSLGSLSSVIILRILSRSSLDSILFDRPIWLSNGISTRNLPGMLICVVRRAPFVPMGSFTIWTKTSSPFFNSSEMEGCLPLDLLFLFSPSAAGSPSISYPEESPVTSETYRNPFFSRPILTNAAPIPGRTESTLPLYTLPSRFTLSGLST